MRVLSGRSFGMALQVRNACVLSVVSVTAGQSFRRTNPPSFLFLHHSLSCVHGLGPVGSVMYNERVKEEKAGAGEERKKVVKHAGPKKDLMDAALDGRNRQNLDVDDDFM